MSELLPPTLARPFARRAFLGGVAASGLLALPGCTSMGGFSLTDAVQRLLFLSSERAFARMLQPNGYWDGQVARLGLGTLLGTRGDVLGRILTSPLFKTRLEGAFADIAFRGAERAAPLVTDAVRTIGFANAIDLVRGGPTAASAYLRGELGTRLLDAMVPELGQALRVASDPLVGQALAALSGVDVPQVAARVATTIDDTIWREIGAEESAIRENPRATNDPLIMGVFGEGAAL